MFLNRFEDIIRFLRFDRRSERARKNDPFAMVREIWESFIINSQLCYKPQQHLTIDEQLLPCKWVIYKEVCDAKISREEFIIKLIEEISELANKQKDKENIQPSNKRSRSQSESRKKCEVKLCKRNNPSFECSVCEMKACGTCIAQTVHTYIKCSE